MSFNNGNRPDLVAKAAAKHEIYQYKSPTMKSMAGGYATTTASRVRRADYPGVDRAVRTSTARTSVGAHRTELHPRDGPLRQPVLPGAGQQRLHRPSPRASRISRARNADKTNCVPGRQEHR